MTDPFPTTEWSLVLEAGDELDSVSRRALERLYVRYSMPIYAAIRRRGFPREDASDLLQDFFAVLIERGTIPRADPKAGRFRAFLQHCLGQFLEDRKRHSAAQKRGGRVVLLELDAEEAEHVYSAELAENDTPDTEFERHWARTVYDAAMSRLRGELDSRGRLEEFERMRGLFVDPDHGEIAAVAREIGKPENTVRKRLQRLRQKFREAFLREVARTVARSEDVEDEARYLIERLG